MLCHDDLTLFIISSIYEHHIKKEKLTTWGIAKLRKWEDLPSNMTCKQASNFFQKKNMLINQRMKSMAKEGFLIVEKCDGKIQFTLIKDRVILLPRHKFPCGYRKAIMINRFDERWVIYQI